jgi:hypothetical protein
MPNSTTDMTSEHVMSIQQPTCQPLVIVCTPKGSSQMGHFTWGAVQRADKSSLLTNDQFRRSTSVSYFQFLMSHQNWR